MIIERKEDVEKIKNAKWVLVYGRRKTGKSFLVENNIKYDEYFFINRDRTIISKNENAVKNYETFIEILRRGLEEEKIIVVDEFHRRGNGFLDFIHSTKNQGV
jgi:AAA+ ATPase superfamily predicted ATPase